MSCLRSKSQHLAIFPTAQLQQDVKWVDGWLATDSQPSWEPEDLINAADGKAVQTTGLCT